MQHNIYPYNPEQFKKQFESTDICRNVAKDFDNLWWNDHEKLYLIQTPRQIVSTASPGFSMIPFYYLQPLLEKTPNAIYDLDVVGIYLRNIFQKLSESIPMITANKFMLIFAHLLTNNIFLIIKIISNRCFQLMPCILDHYVNFDKFTKNLSAW